MSTGFFDQFQSNVEKIVEASLNLTLFCHLHLISELLPWPPPPHLPPLVELLLFLLTLMD